jgi:predicted Zn finger-like uncharacterized protein
MSLITTCPECKTSFIVKPEHLSAHRGNVRCGKCSYVFNALDKLVETEVLPPAPEPSINESFAETPLQETSTEVTADLAPAEPPVTDVIETSVIEPEAETPAVEASPAELDTASQNEPEANPTEIEPDNTSSEPEEPAANIDFNIAEDSGVTSEAPDSEPAIDAGSLPDNDINPEVVDNETSAESSSHDIETALDIYQTPIRNEDIFNEAFTILEDAAPKSKLKTQAEKRRAALKPLLAILAVVLLLLLTGQLMYVFRTPLSIHLPGLKPFLVHACERFGCKVELPKQINLLAIDDSSLQEDESHNGLIHLKAVLINNADFPQAYPIIELTLTDDNDTPVLRRPFTPKEYLKPDSKVEDGIAAGSELNIKLPLMVEDTPLSGYKLFLTY